MCKRCHENRRRIDWFVISLIAGALTLAAFDSWWTFGAAFALVTLLGTYIAEFREELSDVRDLDND